jgi:hypothetical protein
MDTTRIPFAIVLRMFVGSGFVPAELAFRAPTIAPLLPHQEAPLASG